MEGREALHASDKRAFDEDGESDGGYEEKDGGGSLQWISLREKMGMVGKKWVWRASRGHA